MTLPQVMPDSVILATRPILAALIADETVEVRTNLPHNYQPTTDGPVLVVDSFTAFDSWPVLTRPTVRVVAYSNNPNESERLAAKAQGLLCSYDGPTVAYRPLTGPDGGVDDSNHAEISAVEMRAQIRTIPIT